MNLFLWFWLLMAGHCIADTALQTDPMGSNKRRKNPVDLTRVPKGQRPLNLWFMWLTHHAMIHGLVVYLLTQNIYLGMIESFGHWVLDFCKGENYYGPYMDQCLHLSMKLGYAIYLGG